MNILLVYPTILDESQKPIRYQKGYLPPLSLAIIDALTPSQHTVQIVNDCIEQIDYARNFDLVGITAVTTQAERAYQIADKFRELGSKVVIGGVHATFLPDEAKKHADAVIIGEAENLWEQILDDCGRNRLRDFYKEDTYPDLQNVVLPRWENINLELYRRSYGRKFPRMPIYTTRGCVHNCKYCSVTRYFGRTFRFKPVKNVLDEIRSVGAESYFFVDDNIACDPDYSQELFKALAVMDISWFSQASINLSKQTQLIELAAKAGCKHLLLGIESINSANLGYIRKAFNKPSEYQELFERLESVGISPWISYIIGFDHDTPERMEQIVDFLIQNRMRNIMLWILTPLPGTALYSELEQEGRIMKDPWSNYNLTNVVFKPKNFTPQELHETFWQLYRMLFTYRNILHRSFHSAIRSDNRVLGMFRHFYTQRYFRKQVFSKNHPTAMGFNIAKSYSYR